jgi:Meckel syndrome type 1 protein
MELEPVVSYSPIPPDEENGQERVEPRLTVLPLERKRRTARVAPPSAEDAAGRDADIEDAEIIEADFVAPPTRGRRRGAAMLEEEERPRRRMSGVLIVGLVAIVLGVGVLAYTFTRVMNSSAAVTPAATIPATDVAAPSDDSGSAGPGVLALPPEATAPSAADAAKATVPADATPAATEPPPLPRLRPANDANAPAATDTAVAPAPSVPAAPPPAAPVAVTAPAAIAAPATTAPTAAAPSSSDPDVDALMQDVGRFLATPPPSDATTPADVAAGSAPAAAMPANAASVPAATATDDYPPLPAPGQPAQSRWFQDDNGSSIPVPPADIPDPEGADGH